MSGVIKPPVEALVVGVVVVVWVVCFVCVPAACVEVSTGVSTRAVAKINRAARTTIQRIICLNICVFLSFFRDQPQLLQMKPSCRSGGRAAVMSLAAIPAVMPLSVFMRYVCTLARKRHKTWPL
jgi:hypothetical protein